MSDKKKSNNDEGIEFKVLSDSRALIPEGAYSVIYSRCHKAKYWASDKLYIYFDIVDQGLYFKTELFKVYNLYPTLKSGSDLYKDLVFLYGHRVRKSTKLSIKLFKNRVLKVRVRTVKQNRKQIEFVEHQQYSVIDSILSIETSQSLGSSL